MNDPIERDSEEVGVAVAHTEQEVVTEATTTTPNMDDVQGSVETHTDHPVGMEGDAMSSDVGTMEVAETVQETQVESPTVDASEGDTNTQAEKSIYDDPIFGPIKRLMVDILGE